MSAIHLNPGRRHYFAQQRGFALMTAIFLLVILASLGAVMVILSTVQHASSAQDMQGVRAYQSARAGIEWGLYQAMIPEHSNLPNGQTPYSCPSSGTALSSLAGTSTGFNVQVVCSTTTYTEGPNQIGIYQFTSTASFGTTGSAQYVARQLAAAIGTCRTNLIPCNE